ncbi:selenocysteine-specific translation elongation factor [Paraburkholderia bonniea]|uniref:selenocysteine-specific translation elongation factor n=1 Tax=Paraburkholderia bonniea TaxID=2152891 RepID=UPI002572BEDE|nr:selenocysteine-specific translation elongation factor [Paraburkholderia bonniea]WJF92175.1 selenocysteine-specific translation elongation factor [Paraburkholderia bonniea]WJF95495.1 selenocysteine-specific translation elongation factor [Paraburkholderia bonniea]
MIVGTAGHIDHGKTTLVRALTGVDTDRLKEEKARGISIELGYAYTPLENGEVLGIIDVPGHEKLVHTMAAGACGMDFALLVIAADDGVMPQTTEHLAILQLLGVTHGAVALTKVDRVDDARLHQVRTEIRTWLAGTALAQAALFDTCATQSDDPGVAQLREALQHAALTWRARRDDGLFRLAVDRVFTLPGQGTIVTGTVFAGRVTTGATLQLAPAGKRVRVRSIHAQNRASDSGQAGQRCALNLTGIERDELTRGDWIVAPPLGEASHRLDVELTLLPESGLTLRHWVPLHVHLGTLHQVAQVALLDGETLDAGNTARVQLVFDKPVCALPGERFIVRNAQASRTVGGGRVLDPFGLARKRRTPARLAWLEALQRWLEDGRLEHLLEHAPHGMLRSRLMQLSGLPAAALKLPVEAREIPLHGKAAADALVILSHSWEALGERLVAALQQFHQRLPDEPGADAARLRRMAAPLVPDALWRAVLDAQIAAQRVHRSGPWLHLPGHTAALSAAEQALAQTVLPMLTQGCFEPPWVRDLARVTQVPEDTMRALLRKLARQAQVHQVVRDLFYSAEAVHELAQLIAYWVAQHDGAGISAAAFRDATGLGRKRAIQLLEFFDRVGYTRFLREVHLLRTDSWLYNAV